MAQQPQVGFWAWAQNDPGRLALVTPGGEKISAGELLARVNQVSHGLRALGLKKGDGIAILLGNDGPWIEIALATSQIGLYLTPINYHLVGAEAAYILQDCEAKVFVADAAYSQAALQAARETSFDRTRMFSSGKIDGFRLYDELYHDQPATLPLDRVAGQNMNYTSGTTGRPKGVRRPIVPVSPEQAAQLGTMLGSLFEIKPGLGVHLCPGPLYHTAPGAFSLMAMHMGQTLVLMHRWGPEETLQLIEKHKVTTSHMVPTMFHRLLALPEGVKKRYRTDSLRCVIHAAAPCPVDIKKRMLEWWGPVIYEYYAATEGGGTSVKPREWLDHPGTVGRAWPGSTIKVLDDEGNELPVNKPGTVYMSSPIGSFDYFKDKEKTEKSRKKNLFTVGDMGYLTEDGWLFLCDRKADMIISGGVNIYPAEIEGIFLSHPQVADVAVFGVPDDDWGEAVKAVVQPASGVTGNEAFARQLLEFAADKLAKYKLPRSIDFRSELPREPSGKLFKRKLRDDYWKGMGRQI
ncbi:MAG: acyl-CoA synthetase [Bdellovibrionota bacterium]